MLVQDGTIKERINWVGVLAGTVTGIATQLALTVLGVAIGAASIDTASGLAWGTIIWLAISVAISAWLGGLVAARAAGYLTPAQGRFNGLITGMLLALATTLLLSNALTSGLRAAAGLVGGAATAVTGAATAAGTAAANSNVLQSDPVQSILSGLNPQNIAQIVADNSPNLNEAQATAATNVITNIVSRASNDIGNNLSNISNLSDIVTNRVKSIQSALSGPQFVTRLQRAGLSQASAQATAAAIGQQVTQLQQQATNTAQAAERIARRAATTAAWSALLALGLILGLATLGGGMGSDVPKGGATVIPNRDEARGGRA